MKDENKPASQQRGKHYRAVWRWHFYAGLLVSPVLLVLAITGAIYLFERELNDWWNKDLLVLAPHAQQEQYADQKKQELKSLAEQESFLRQQYPQAKIRSVKLPKADNHAYLWQLQIPNTGSRLIYLDPYQLRINGEQNPSTQPLNIVRDLHGELLAGDAGSYLVELTACWTFIMLITGAYLWWPKRWQWRGVLVPRIADQGRSRWRDLHAIPALCNALLVSFLVLSGLPWSVFWGAQFAKLGEVTPWVAASPNFKSAPSLSSQPQAAHAQHQATNETETNKLPWVIQHTEAPHIAHHNHASPIQEPHISAAENFLKELPIHEFGPGVRIFYPASTDGVFTISYVPDKAEGQHTLYINPLTGALIQHIRWSDYSPVAKAIEWGVMVHMGLQYGAVNQWLAFVVCMILVASIILGIYLWLQRRPKGELAAPPVYLHDKLPNFLVISFIVSGIIFPLLGLSLIMVIAIDYLLSKARPQTHDTKQ